MNNSIIAQEDLYPLPVVFKGKLKRRMHFLCGSLVCIFTGFIFIPGDDIVKILLNAMCALFALLFGFFWFALAVWRKPYVILTEECFEYKWIFGHKTVALSAIYHMAFLSDQGVTVLGFWAHQQGKRTFWEKTDRLFGRDYTFAIPVLTFATIDFDKLCRTLLSKIRHQLDRQ
ncbi:hypothetical protein [Cohnella sp. JJ-181]|uniref:hypothetical protein n=1 Tax=Cohnella rhizoplanae TaxID=2974897 RepID=UPI0022FF761B|nr:hypothetical protein [Cohnella sp. JJ-181]CAI6085743.1 hypothetical protein COHCIP112018_04777 [Cohnella sp. JJ-181]